MVNCKGVVSSPKSFVNHEICRNCRTRVCEECYVAVTSRSSRFQSQRVHQHVCLACTQSRPRGHQQSRLLRLNSAPIKSGGPRIDSLSNMARDRGRRTRSSQPTAGFLTAEDQPQQYAAAPKKDKKTAQMELSTVDLRRRRHTSAIAPTSRSADVACPSRPSKARQLLRVNATELQEVRRQANNTELHTSRRHESTSSSTAIRDAASTEPKDMELTIVDLRVIPTAQSCSLTDTRPIFDMSDEPTELELSTVDLRFPKHKVNIPASTKRGRTSATDRAKRTPTSISIENLAAVDAKLSSVELNLKRYDVPLEDIKQQSKEPSSVSSGDGNNSTKSKKQRGDRIDFHLSTVDLRPRPLRHTRTDTLTQKPKSSRRKNQSPEIQEHVGLELFQRKKTAEPIDFHLSTFDLKPRRHTTDSKPEPNQVQARRESHSKETIGKKMNEVPEQTPTYSKGELCDLAYLENFRSYTL